MVKVSKTYLFARSLHILSAIAAESDGSVDPCPRSALQSTILKSLRQMDLGNFAANERRHDIRRSKPIAISRMRSLIMSRVQDGCSMRACRTQRKSRQYPAGPGGRFRLFAI
jgi:hypothetical protein